MAVNFDRRDLLKGLGSALIGLSGLSGIAAAEKPKKAKAPDKILPAERDWIEGDADRHLIARFLEQWEGTVFAVSRNGIVVQPPTGRPFALPVPEEIARLQGDREVPVSRGEPPPEYDELWELHRTNRQIGEQGVWFHDPRSYPGR